MTIPNWFNKTPTKIIFAYFLFWIFYFTFVWSNVITTSPTSGVITHQVNIWGDWAAHFTMGSSMAYNHLLPKDSPLLLGTGFVYPFISDLISALLIKIKMPFFAAFIIPSFIFSIMIIIALFYFYKILFSSKKIAIIASLIFLLNGGIGFIYYFQDITNSSTPITTALNPPREYTNIETTHYRWISVISSMIIPQRAFTLGFPLSLLTLTLIYQILIDKKQNKKLSTIQLIKLGSSIAVIGLMPIIHSHSFLNIMLILFFWGLGDMIQNYHQVKIWTITYLSISLLAFIVITKFSLNSHLNDFFKWYPGWYTNKFPDQNWWLFWLKNWGLVPLMAVMGFLLSLLAHKKKRQVFNQHIFFTFLPFFLIFAFANLFLIQPFIWDNTKLIVWASIGFSGLTAYLLFYFYKKTTKKLCKMTLFLIFFLTIFSGGLDAYKILRQKVDSFTMYTAEEIELADWVKNNTPTNSIWLTSDKHNHWLYNLTGRQPIMAYRGWLWTHGYQYQQTEKAVSAMFHQPEKNLAIYQQYHVSYVVVGPSEKEDWHAAFPPFSNSFKIIKQTPNYKLYAL